LLAHDAAPHEALATLGHHKFTGRTDIERRLVEALAAGGQVESKMLLGAHVTPEGADYYAQVNPKQSPRLIQYRKAEKTIEILAGRDALAALEETIAADLTRANPDALTLANIMRNKKGYHVQLRDRVIEISEAEYKTIAAGKPLDDAHPLSQALATDKPFVIYSNPLMRTAKYMSEAESFGFSLQAAYPRVTILRDDYTPATDERAAQLHALGAARPADFVAVVDDGSFKVKDFKVLADIQKRLKDNGWNVVNYKPGTAWTHGTGKTLSSSRDTSTTSWQNSSANSVKPDTSVVTTSFSTPATQRRVPASSLRSTKPSARMDACGMRERSRLTVLASY
jgi:hypothetical protein